MLLVSRSPVQHAAVTKPWTSKQLEAACCKLNPAACFEVLCNMHNRTQIDNCTNSPGSRVQHGFRPTVSIWLISFHIYKRRSHASRLFAASCPLLPITARLISTWGPDRFMTAGLVSPQGLLGQSQVTCTEPLCVPVAACMRHAFELIDRYMSNILLYEYT